jgi:hypothetical protein
MSKTKRDSGRRQVPTFGLSTALFALLLGAITVTTTGCVLPVLGLIPSVLSLAYNVVSRKGDTAQTDAAAKDQEAVLPSTDSNITNVSSSDATSTPAKPTALNACHLMALARPDLMVVELRKNTAGVPEYRELHLITSPENARWTPVVDSETDPTGWRPAVNFLKMDFKPALTDVIPNSGSCYLAYIPLAPAADGSIQATSFNSAPGDAAGAFSWNGQSYQYKVDRTLPCLTPDS